MEYGAVPVKIEFKSRKHKGAVLAHPLTLAQQQVRVREDNSDVVRQKRRGLPLVQQSTHQMGKRAALRYDNLFTDEGVYTNDTSSESLGQLFHSWPLTPTSTARVIDDGMSGHTAASGSDASDEPTATSTCSSGHDDSGANANGTQHFQRWRRRQRHQDNTTTLSACSSGEDNSHANDDNSHTCSSGEDDSDANDANDDTTTFSTCNGGEDSSHTNANDTQHFHHVEMTTAMPTTTTLTLAAVEKTTATPTTTQRHSALAAMEKTTAIPTPTTLSTFSSKEEKNDTNDDTTRHSALAVAEKTTATPTATLTLAVAEKTTATPTTTRHNTQRLQ